MEESATQDIRQTIPLRSVPAKSPLNIVGKILPLLIILIIIAAGIVTGFYVSQIGKPKTVSSAALSENQDVPAQVKESFAQTFKDNAEGVIQKNDKKDKYAQGTHVLIRSGGDSQTAYLTSSVLDLDQYVGKKVKVYGETFGSTQVGWLMDVGKVEVQ